MRSRQAIAFNTRHPIQLWLANQANHASPACRAFHECQAQLAPLVWRVCVVLEACRARLAPLASDAPLVSEASRAFMAYQAYQAYHTLRA